MKKPKKALKSIFRITGIGLLMFEFLVISILFLDNSQIIWGSILPTLIITPVLGVILLYVTRNRSKPFLPQKDISKPANQNKYRLETEKEMSFHSNDIVCMAVIYEGNLPVGHVLDNVSLAQEIIDTAHTQGLPLEIKLCLDTVIQIQRANEIAFWEGGYEPKNDLKPMIERCYKDVREKFALSGDFTTKLHVKDMVFKTRSTLVSTVWVQINVMQ